MKGHGLVQCYILWTTQQYYNQVLAVAKKKKKKKKEAWSTLSIPWVLSVDQTLYESLYLCFKG